MIRVEIQSLLVVLLLVTSGCGEVTNEPLTGCETDSDCVHPPDTYCEPISGDCVECTSSDHCPDGEVCEDFSCRLEGCRHDEDCLDPELGICDSETNECVECLENEHCDHGMICRSRACEAYEPPDGWSVLEVPSAEELRSVACRDGRVWAAGDNGTILHSRNGFDFEAQDTSSVTSFSSIDFADAQYGVVVGGVEILETTDGGDSWSPSWFCTVIAMSEYHRVVVVSEGTGYAIGQSHDDEGTFKYRIPQGWNCFTGQTWPSYTLLTGAFTGQTRGFMTGDTGGHVLKTDDMWTWETVDSGFPQVFHGMGFRDGNTGWIVGEGGLVLRTDDGGESWRRLAEGLTSQTLRSVAAMDENVVVAVGDAGTILESTDGGETFSVASSAEASRLNELCFLGEAAYVVGEDGLLLTRSRFPTP